MLFDVEDDAAVWTLSDYLARYVTDWVSKLDGYTKANKFRVADAGGSSLERDDIESLRAAVRENHFTPSRLQTSIHFKRGLVPLPEDARDIDRIQFDLTINMLADLEVDLWSDFAGEYSEPGISVNIESADRLVRDGLEAQLLAESQQLKHEIAAAAAAPESTPSHASQNNVFHGPVNVGVIGEGGAVGSIGSIGSSESAADTKPDSGFAVWIARTWRDHTVTFVLTVVGAVAAAAIGLWIGLTP